MANVFTAAGVAAALAVSLTALAAPIDGARAASPTSNVNVVNPATEPALTRSVDDPGRIAYQSTATCNGAGNSCNFLFPAVPKGHRLVVQHVSGHLNFTTDASGVEVDFNGDATEAFSSFLAPPSFQRTGIFDQPVLLYFDGGSEPILFTSADASFNTSPSQATLSGYLLDCVTTPCAAIAP
jgi:hypothetical protein